MMTAARIARAGRVRFFIGLGILVITMGFVAMFHSSQQQLDQSRRMEMRCEQQQDALTAQIADLENKLKSERQQHHELKLNLEREAREQTDKKEQAVHDINLKLTSLQQHYKLLKNQHDDYTDECSKTKSKQLSEINALQGKVKSLQNQNEQTAKEKDKDIELWKAKHSQLLREKQLLEKGLSTSVKEMMLHKLQQEIDEYKSHCEWRPIDKIVGPTVVSKIVGDNNAKKSSTTSSVEKNFNAQIAVSDNLYEIPIKYTNNTVRTMTMGNDSDKLNSNHGDGLASVKSSQTKVDTSFKSDTVINSVENFQFVPKPLADSMAAPASQLSGPTTAGSMRKTSETNGEIKMNVAPNAPLPDQLRASSTTAASKKIDENKQMKSLKQLPNGVVPFQPNLDDISDKKTMDKNEEDLGKPQENNRYVNVVDEANENNEKKAIDDSLKELQNADGNNDTGAREVNDSNDFVVDEHNHQGHVQGAFDQKDGLIDNAAEEDLNVYANKLSKLGAKDGNDNPNGSDDDLQVVHRAEDADEDNRISLNGNKLKNEVNADKGNAYQDEANPEEPGEDEDDDDYNGHLHKEPAIRARR